MGAIALLLMAAQPAATADQLGFDIQCMVATQMATEQLKGPTAMATQMAAMFYFGRVDAILAGQELEDRMAAEAKSIEGKPLGPLLERCGSYMQVRGKAMEAVGQRLEAREKAPKLN